MTPPNQGPPASPSSDVVCLCTGVSRQEILGFRQDNPGADFQFIQIALGCGAQCGCCTPIVKDLLGESAWYPTTVTGQLLTPDSQDERRIAQFELTLTDSKDYPVALAGQYVTLQLITPQAVVHRSYTVVKQSADKGRITIAVRRLPDGQMSPHLHAVAFGELEGQVSVSVPGGEAFISTGDTPIVCVVAGIGVTLAQSIANYSDDSLRLHIDYSARDKNDFVYTQAFEARRKTHANFSYTLRDEALDGRINAQAMADLAAQFPNARYYLCGPATFAAKARRYLVDAQVPREAIKIEEFFIQQTVSPSDAQAAVKPAIARRRIYQAAFLLMLLPLLLVWVESWRSVLPHNHMTKGHQDFECKECHVDAPGTVRQQLQAKAKALVGLRDSSAPFMHLPVNNQTCSHCHQRPDDRHSPNRFMEPRFAKARATIGPEQCVSCHREHNQAAVTVSDAGYCVQCHYDLKVDNDKVKPSHAALIAANRWETCLQCHDFHGNHKRKTPDTLEQALSLSKVSSYLKDGQSPYGPLLLESAKPKKSQP